MTIMDVASWLKKRKEKDLRTTLFLGARAGGLYRSTTFYATSQFFSLYTFHDMAQIQQFGECYRVLCKDNFSSSDRDSILIASLRGLKSSESDTYLANLVQDGLFDMVISTNIDNLLPTAFEKVGMRKGEDFQIFIPKRDSSDEVMSYQHKYPSTFIKIFGDLEIGDYTLFKQDFYLETHNMLKIFLNSTLSQTLLMIGYDPFWDRAIDALFPIEGQEILYVNEENPSLHMFTILQNRESRYIVGEHGEYEFFMRKLHQYLEKDKNIAEAILQGDWRDKEASIKLKQSPEVSMPTAITTTQSEDPQTQDARTILNKKEQRTFVFIGYQRKDQWYLEKLKTHMAHYEREKLLNVWDDQKVKPGTNYETELQYVLNNTRVAILLVSPNFIASNFIAKNILPPLLQTAKEGGAIILPVIIKPCVFEDTELQQFQPINNPSEPLSSKNATDKDKVLADLVRYVITLGKNIEHD